MRCPNCGKAVDENSRFCPYCGDDLMQQLNEREIYSNSSQKRIDQEIRQIEKKPSDNFDATEFDSDDFYDDGYNSPVSEKQEQTQIFELNQNSYAPYAPEDIDEYGNEKQKKGNKLFVAIIVCGSIIITAAIIFATIIFGKNCASGGSVSPTEATSVTDPTAPTTATAETFEVPDVLGYPEEDAVSTLESLGFKVSILKQNSDLVDEGRVIDQSPKSGNRIEAGGTVTLSVSLGSEDSTEEETGEPTEATEETETEAKTETEAERTISYYILPESDQRYLDYTDIADISGFDLVLARNEIYARHGRKFDSAEVQEYFNKCTWYNGTTEPENFDESVLNAYERANVDFILQKEYSGG